MAGFLEVDFGGFLGSPCVFHLSPIYPLEIYLPNFMYPPEFQIKYKSWCFIMLSKFVSFLENSLFFGFLIPAPRVRVTPGAPPSPASSHAFGATLLKGEDCSSRLKPAPGARSDP